MLPKPQETPYLLILFATLIAASPGFSQHYPPKEVEAFFSEHCYDCHDDTTSKGSLNLFDLEFELGNHSNFEAWERIFSRVENGEMPPEKKPRPDETKKAAFLAQLEKPMLAADLKEKREIGSVHVRRLTRREYENTLHDLLGIDLPLQELLPEDPATHGFETVAEGQQLSHHNLASYLEAADIALEEAFGRLSPEGEAKYQKTFPAEKVAYQNSGPGNYRGPELRDGYSISWPITLQFYGRMRATAVPESGWYRVTLKEVHGINVKDGAVWGTLRSGTCSSSSPMLFHVGTVEATAQKRDLTFEAWIREGHMLELKPNDASLKRAPSGAKGGKVSYKGLEHEKAGIKGIAVKAIEMERIYPNAKRWELRTKLFGGISKEDLPKLQQDQGRKELVTRAIRNFASRAFRRPVTNEQVALYVDLALEAMDEPGKKPVDGLKAAYRAVLCSPRFLTLIEKPGVLDDHAIASRLSYTLWNSMPDAKLRTSADEGKLKDWKVLHAHISRMVENPKSDRFIESFTDQWLNLKEIDFTTPDTRRFRSFDSVVQDSMLAETRAFVRELMRNNLPITHLIDSDFAMWNERLARFYGITDVPLKVGDGLQRVSLDNHLRGGLVTQGAVLKVTANGTTTSPVIRGVWVGERILGLEIPPPPADVPAVEPDIRGAVSIRDQLTKHMNSETCAGCHRNIDPAGFALENFDAVGLWRQKYGTQNSAAVVDPSGITPDGVEFADLKAWKKIYVQRPDQLTEAFARQLLTYATGAPPRFSDRQAIEKIVKSARDKNYGVRSIIHSTLGSEVFRTK